MKTLPPAIFKRFAGPYDVTEPVLTEIAHVTGRDKLIVETFRAGPSSSCLN